MNDKKEYENSFSYSKEKLANFIARIASETRKGTLEINGESVDIPQHVDVKYSFETDEEENEVEIKFKWKK